MTTTIGTLPSANEPLDKLSQLSRPVDLTDKLVVIGNPENRRVSGFLEAADKLGFGSIRVVSYQDLLTNFEHAIPGIPAGSHLRLESPGENADVDRSMKRLSGMPCAPQTAHGEICDQPAWYAGFTQLLLKLEQRLSADQVRWMNPPRDICRMFDKLSCQRHLIAAGIPVPTLLGCVESYDHLCSLQAEHASSRVFLKLRFGSSASGVVALRTNGKQTLATTTVEMVPQQVGLAQEVVPPRLFNSLRLRRYESTEDIRQVVNALARQQIYAEAWMPKAGVDGKTFDLRVLMIAGQVAHVVVRTSSGPLTNLHLGNARGDLNAVKQLVPDSTLEAVWNSCRSVAREFPESLYMGIDVLITADTKRHAILEVNAFGDLLPGALHNGADTYTAELLAALR